MLTGAAKTQDHYSTLNLPQRYAATAAEIKAAHRSAALRCHPDRGATDDAEMKAVSTAIAVLGDATKRRLYDSTYDSTIVDKLPVWPPPADEYFDDDFYDTFREAFRVNARWAVVGLESPATAEAQVPQFGDAGTPPDEVQKFYRYWNNFVSRRLFDASIEPYSDESEDSDDLPNELDECKNRYEKRDLLREIDRARRRRLVADNARIKRLVALARAHDPRLAAATAATATAAANLPRGVRSAVMVGGRRHRGKR